MKTLVAINYSWEENSHLLFARAEGEILEIFDYKKYPSHTTYSEVASKVKTIKYDKLFSNFFEPLQLELRAIQFEEIEFQDEKLKSLEAIFNNLIESERLTILEDLETPSNDTGFDRCLQILIKGAIRSICKRKSGISLPKLSTYLPHAINDFFPY